MSENNAAADVEAVFEFNMNRRSPVFDGYRTTHQVTGTGRLVGIHHYTDTKMVKPGGTARGTITFSDPDVCPHCLSAGKVIQIIEGKDTVVGQAVITAVNNPLLAE